ncbi:unnamed protein product, partial [Meganyctiphanes norvegica]
MESESELEKRKRELLSQLENGYNVAAQQEEGSSTEMQENKINDKINNSSGSNTSSICSEEDDNALLESVLSNTRVVSPDITVINGDVLHNETLLYHPVSKRYDFQHPVLAMNYNSQYNTPVNNFTKGCKWAPDGTCLLVASEDKKLRLFNLPPPVATGNFLDSDDWIERDCHKYSPAAITAQEGELIYDYTWYPAMKSSDPQSCCKSFFKIVCPEVNVPIGVAWTAKIDLMYSGLDEMVTARSISFNLDGTKLLCGFKKTIRVFNTARPGRQFQSIDSKGQPGIISCFAFHPQLPNIFAAGSYQGTIGITLINVRQIFFILYNGGQKILKLLILGVLITNLWARGIGDNSEIQCSMQSTNDVLLDLEKRVGTNPYFYVNPFSSRFPPDVPTHPDVLRVWN